MDIFERTKEIAKRKGYSLRKVEEEAGLSANSLYNWKKSNPKSENVEKVAKVLNVSVDYLLGRDVVILELPPIFDNHPGAEEYYKVRITRSIDSDITSRNSVQPTDVITIDKWSPLSNQEEDGHYLESSTVDEWQNFKIPALRAESVFAPWLSDFVEKVIFEVEDKLKRRSALEWRNDNSSGQMSEVEEFTLMAAHWGRDLNKLSEEERQKVIKKAEAYVTGLIDALDD